MKRAVVIISALLAAGVALGAPITVEQARQGMVKWVESRPAAHLQAQLGTVASARTVRGAGGQALCHVVGLDKGGYIVTSTDDRIKPVIAFSDSGTLTEDERNPLWAMLKRDLPHRLSVVEAAAKTTAAAAAGTAAKATLAAAAESNACEWADLLADDDAPSPAGFKANLSSGLSSVPDVRVPMLLSTKWNQETDLSGSYCYNYYTPSHYCCGCVATATAQLMRKHAYPTDSVTAKTFGCWIAGAETSKTMYGGTYSWSSMPNEPGSGSTTAQRQAIGKLCYDVGVASRMNWSSGSSGACLLQTAESLQKVFKYANVRSYIAQSSLSSSVMKSTIFANLDAGCPVLLGIEDDSGNNGHAIVADGYGYSGSTIYTHLNLGWSGSSDAWYALPDIGTGYDFSVVDEVIYNIFPTKTGELLTGRVTNSSGNPISGAVVTVANSGQSMTVTTNERGIYAATVSAGTWKVSVTSAAGYEASATKSVTVDESVSCILADVSAEGCSYYDVCEVGNSWGNNFTLTAKQVVTHTVTFNLGTRGTRSGGGALVQTVNDGAAATAPTVTAKTGYAWTGWDRAFSSVKSDLTVNAVYSLVSYTLTYSNLKGATNPSANPSTYTIEDSIVFAGLPDVSGYSFTGWSPASISAGTTGSKTITAQWEAVSAASTATSVASTSYYSGLGGFLYSVTLSSGKTFLVSESELKAAGIDVSGGVTAALLNGTGRNGIPRLQSYYLGLDANSDTPASEQFRANISFDANGLPVIDCTPKTGSDFVTYTTLGKTALTDAAWTEVTDDNRAKMKFFRVRAEVK